jgi:hypothetical protein
VAWGVHGRGRWKGCGGEGVRGRRGVGFHDTKEVPHAGAGPPFPTTGQQPRARAGPAHTGKSTTKIKKEGGGAELGGAGRGEAVRAAHAQRCV